ncbi:MAG: hypothetical protein GY751_05075 [Bacteroidetes bacterium]|nr:hypothetical protein [Bacteroidota bacterium]
MRIYFSARIVLAGVLFCLFNYNASGQTISSGDLLNPSQVPSEFYGFNGEYMIDQCLDTDDPRTNPPQPLNTLYLDQTCRILVDELNPGLIRFPGGTTANYYHFNGTGYGYIESETFGTEIGVQQLGFDGLMPVNFIELFADMALQTNSKVIFTINIYTHFKPGGASLNNPDSDAYQWRFQENMDAIAYLMNRGVDLVGIELGNELYTYAEFTSIFTIGTAIDKYLSLANAYSSAINQAYPNLKIGVPVAIHRGYGNIFWNEKMQAAEFADGVIPHEYERKVYSSCDPDVGQVSYFDCAQSTIDLFFETDFEATVNEYLGLYPNKEIWLTEWGMSQPQGISNTLFDAYFVFKYWNKLMELEKSYPGKITYTNRHNLVTGGYYYSAFGNQQFVESSEVLYLNNKAIRANAYSSMLMKEIYDGSHQFIGKTTINGCDVWIYTQGGVKYKMAVINESGTDTAIDISVLNSILNETTLEFSNFSYLTADQFYSAAGINYYELDGSELTNNLTYKNEIEVFNPGSVEINSRSLSVVELEVGEPEPFALNSFSTSEEACNIEMSWNVTSDAPGIQYIISSNGTPIDTVPSTGYAVSNSYQYSTSSDQTTSLTFKISAITDGSPLASLEAEPLQVDCAPIPNPEVASVHLGQEGECGLSATWFVENDLAGIQYHLIIELEGQGEAFSTIVPSNGNGSYAISYNPSSNGVYTASVHYEWEEGLTIPVTSTSSTVECIIPPAAITEAGISQSEGCTYRVNWTVSNETTESNYTLSVEYGGSTEVLQSFNSQGDLTIAEYSFLYTPSDNGSYSFSLEHFTNGEVVSTTENLIAEVSCVQPQITSSEYILDQTCATLLSWTVFNDLAGSQYLVHGSIDDENSAVLATISSNGSGSYQFSQNVEVNGIHRTSVSSLYNGNETSNSELHSVDIQCIPVSEPAFESFDISLSQVSCEIVLQWSVSNEATPGTYLIYAANENEDFTIAGEITIESNQDLAEYSFTYNPQNNGNHQLYIKRTGNTNIQSGLQSIAVSCITQPVIELFTIADNEDCSFTLNWEVSNEEAGAIYEVLISQNNGAYHILTTEDSEPAAGLTSYQVLFTPAENDHYSFLIHRTENGEIQSSASPAAIMVDCIINPVPDPSFVSFDVTLDENCSFNFQWTVSNETDGATYAVYARFNDDEFVLLESITGQAAATIANYEFTFQPTKNGLYSFYAERDSEGQVITSNLASDIDVTCVPKPNPAIETFDVTLDEHCSFDIQWSVSYETSGGSYLLQARMDGGSSEVIAILASQNDLELAEYQFNFVPTENGTYSFSVERISEGQVSWVSASIDVITTCVPAPPASIQSYTVSFAEPCSFVFQWSVLNENANASYVLKKSRNNGAFETIVTIFSPGSIELAGYQYIYHANMNGVYEFRLERYEGNLLSTTETIPDIEIDCIESPDAGITSLSMNPEGSCTYQLNWSVCNENLYGSYNIYASYNGNAFELIHEMPSLGNLRQAFYDYDFMPESDGDYILAIRRMEGLEITTVSDLLFISVDCIIEIPAVIEQFAVTASESCTYTLDWEVSNETNQGNYRVMVSSGDFNFIEVARIASSGEAASASYQYDYQAEQDGSHFILIQRYESELFQSNSPLQQFDVFCFTDPEFSAVHISEENCELTLSWAVSNEVEQGNYNILVSLNGATYEVAGSMTSTESTVSAVYQFYYSPTENGIYEWMIVRSDEENPLITSQIVSIMVNCIAAPPPAIELFALTENENCTMTLNWSVSNETAAGTYNVLYRLDGDEYVSLTSIPSNGNLEFTGYSFTMDPQYNGYYEFLIERNGGGAQINSEINALYVDCVEDPVARFEDYAAIATDCYAFINWSVSGQSASNTYLVYAAKKGDALEMVETISAGSGTNQSFSYLYHAPEQGEYKFRVEILSNDQFVESTDEMSAEITCSTAPIPFEIKVNPSITDGPFYIKISLPANAEADIRIVNSSTGFVAHEQQAPLHQGANVIRLNMDNFNGATTGLYSVVVIINGIAKSKALMYSN